MSVSPTYILKNRSLIRQFVSLSQFYNFKLLNYFKIKYYLCNGNIRHTSSPNQQLCRKNYPKIRPTMSRTIFLATLALKITHDCVITKENMLHLVLFSRKLRKLDLSPLKQIHSQRTDFEIG